MQCCCLFRRVGILSRPTRSHARLSCTDVLSCDLHLSWHFHTTSSVQLVWNWCMWLYMYIKPLCVGTLCIWMSHEGPWQNVNVWWAGDEKGLHGEGDNNFKVSPMCFSLWPSLGSWGGPCAFPICHNLPHYILRLHCLALFHIHPNIGWALDHPSSPTNPMWSLIFIPWLQLYVK